MTSRRPGAAEAKMIRDFPVRGRRAAGSNFIFDEIQDALLNFSGHSHILLI
jgi:hypothetical protein